MKTPNCDFCELDSDDGKIHKGYHIVIEREFGNEKMGAKIVNHKFVLKVSSELVFSKKVNVCHSCFYTYYCTAAIDDNEDSKFDGGNEMFETNYSIGAGKERELKDQSTNICLV